MKKILMALIAIGSLANADFTKSGDIVTDSTTGLMWQDDAIAASTTAKWQVAIDRCEALELGGHTDWRLPNLNELTSLADDTKVEPSISPAFTNVVAFGKYWSSTTHAGYSSGSGAWYVYFHDGSQGHYNKLSGYYVRCVRAGQ